MPVTINGSGSITGLAVGGLPDGSVDADTLATNAVTTNKIANGAAVGTKLGSGSIIQFVVGSGGGNQASGGCNATASGTTTTNTNDVIDAYMTFTPLLSTSTIFVLISTGCSINGNYATFYIKESVSGSTIGQTGWGNFGGAQSLEGLSFTGVHKPGNTVQRTYQLICNQVGTPTRYINYNAICQMMIMEIAV